MTAKSKKSKSAGRFKSRYGKSVRGKIAEIEAKQKKKQICIFCKKKTVKRLSKGIWFCKSCKKKFASGTFTVD